MHLRACDTRLAARAIRFCAVDGLQDDLASVESCAYTACTSAGSTNKGRRPCCARGPIMKSKGYAQLFKPRLHEMMTRLAEIDQRQGGAYGTDFEGRARIELSKLLWDGLS